MASKAKPKPKRGGARSGAGRKPAAATVARRKLEDSNIQTAQAAFNFMVTVMLDGQAKTEVRVDCAKYIQDRVWGKATVSVRNDPDLPVLVDDLPV